MRDARDGEAGARFGLPLFLLAFSSALGESKVEAAAALCSRPVRLIFCVGLLERASTFRLLVATNLEEDFVGPVAREVLGTLAGRSSTGSSRLRLLVCRFVGDRERLSSERDLVSLRSRVSLRGRLTVDLRSRCNLAVRSSTYESM